VCATQVAKGGVRNMLGRAEQGQGVRHRDVVNEEPSRKEVARGTSFSASTEEKGRKMLQDTQRSGGPLQTLRQFKPQRGGCGGEVPAVY